MRRCSSGSTERGEAAIDSTWVLSIAPTVIATIRTRAIHCCEMSTISLDLIPAFLAVAELGSFSEAALRLSVEKSSVSRAVARLEHALGDRLFLRTTRRVALTD